MCEATAIWAGVPYAFASYKTPPNREEEWPSGVSGRRRVSRLLGVHSFGVAVEEPMKLPRELIAAVFVCSFAGGGLQIAVVFQNRERKAGTLVATVCDRDRDRDRGRGRGRGRLSEDVGIFVKLAPGLVW